MSKNDVAAFFKSFEWALSTCNEHFSGKDAAVAKFKPDDVGDTLIEYLENWCGLLERLVNPKNMLESPHALPPKSYHPLNISFSPLHFLIHIQKVMHFVYFELIINTFILYWRFIPSKNIACCLVSYYLKKNVALLSACIFRLLLKLC